MVMMRCWGLTMLKVLLLLKLEWMWEGICGVSVDIGGIGIMMMMRHICHRIIVSHIVVGIGGSIGRGVVAIIVVVALFAHAVDTIGEWSRTQLPIKLDSIQLGNPFVGQLIAFLGIRRMVQRLDRVDPST